MKRIGLAIQKRFQEPSTYLAIAMIFYITSGNDIGDLGEIIAWLQEHRDMITYALGLLGIVLKEGR